MTPIGEVSVLGEIKARVSSGSAVDLPGSRSRELLAALSVSPGSKVRREHLCAQIWPESSELGARKALNTELWRLRNAIRDAGGDSGSWIQSDQGFVRLCPENGLAVDLVELQGALQAGGSPSLEQLHRAVSLYRGEFAADLRAEWLDAEREAIRKQFCRLLELTVNALREARMFGDAFAYAERLISEDRFDERGHRALLLLHLESGNKSAAVQHFRELRSLLSRELGVEPSDETTALVRPHLKDDDGGANFSIVAQDPAAYRSLALTRHRLSKLRQLATDLTTLVAEIERDLGV